jgi:hypothetical protein
MSIFGGAGAYATTPFNLMGESVSETNYKVNDDIEVLSTYHGAIHKKEKERYLLAQTSQDVMEGDLIILFIASSGGVHKTLPEGFRLAHETVKDKGDLAVKVAYKVWHYTDPVEFVIPKETRNFFVTMLTIRGAKNILDTNGKINTARGKSGEAYSPRVDTDIGALITAFVYDDPHVVEIKKQKTLVSFKNGDDGMAVGISETDGGLSKRIHACANSTQRGGGDDIAVAISIH